MPEFQIIQGDALSVLRTLEAESVHTCVTSPPYYGLRAYGSEPQIWGGEAACDHQWGEVTKHRSAGGPQVPQSKWKACESVAVAQRDTSSGLCSLCGAWRGEFGQEPDFRLYLQHAVEIFREVRRVLRPDGTLWLNIGDSFATGGGAVGECPGGGEQGARWKGFRGDHPHDPKRNGAAIPIGPQTQMNRMPQPGLKPKDLMMIPARMAIALQEDGWYVRMDIVWNKPNPMPESVTDRPTKSHEYVFLLAKSEKYYFDHEAVQEKSTGTAHDRARKQRSTEGQKTLPTGERNGIRPPGVNPKCAEPGSGIKQNASFSEAVKWTVEVRNIRSVWTIPTEAYPEAHFATFPEALVRPCILAGCPKGGTVLDPFAGSGTTMSVAKELGCSAIGIELNPAYIPLIEKRLAQDVLPLEAV